MKSLQTPSHSRRGAMRALSCLAAGGLVWAGLGGRARAQGRADPDRPDTSPQWLKVRAALFKQRPIRSPAEDLLRLEAPARAEDAAIVPLAIQTVATPTGDATHIRKLWLVIDNNPSPLAAVFDFEARSARADIETRVRIDEYTHVRAIAETADGQLHMTSRYVKASGGCSAPPGKDQAAAMASLGRMRMRVEGEVQAGRPLLAQLMISHPNNSGMVMDQLTRQYTPAHFVRTVRVSYAGEPVLTADLDFAISENPNLRFWFVPGGEGELKAEVVDSEDLHFESALKLRLPA